MKRFIAMLLVFAVIAGGGYAFAESGGATDPLVSLSYLMETVKSAISSNAAHETEEQVGALMDGYVQRLESSAGFQTSYMSHAPQFTEISLEESAALELGRFACFMPGSGKMVLRVSAGDVIELSSGKTVADGTLLTANRKYFAAENAVARVVSYTEGATGFIDGYYDLGSAAGFGENEVFYDMFTHWGAEYVYELYAMGVIDGMEEHRFFPNTTVTRGMLVTILGRVHGVEPSFYTVSGFDDVAIGKWYGPYVAWAQEAGVVEGFEDGTFKPDSNVTREQMALIFMRFADYVGAELPGGEAEPFADEGKIGSWALDAVNYARATGLIDGREGNIFDPKGTATRAEICAVTSRFIEKFEASRYDPTLPQASPINLDVEE